MQWSVSDDASLLAWAAKYPKNRYSNLKILSANLGRPVSKDAAEARLRRLAPTWRPKPPSPHDASRDIDTLRLQAQIKDLESAKDHLLQELADKDGQLQALSSLRQSPPPIIDKRPRGESHTRRGVPVLLCSDWHVEEPVDPKKVAGLNRYNLTIADKCIGELPDALEWLTRDTRFDCKEAVVWLGGDLFSGYIHEELTESNFLSPVQAVIWLQSRVEAMLRRILSLTKFELIRVVCNDGNHGRLTRKIRVSTRTANSLEWLLYQTLATRFESEPRISFQIAEGEWNYLDIFGKAYGFAHGDTFQYGGGVGGLLIPVRKGVNELRKYRALDHVTLGHFHTRTDDTGISINGSMIGINPYSMSKKFPPEPRQQSYFMIDSTRGKCISAPVWFSAK